MAKDDARFNATTPGKRFLKLASMSASITTKLAANKVGSLFSKASERDQQQSALLGIIGEQIAKTLGEMKGAVMKVGQIASQMQDLLPPEVASALSVLQKESPPMPYERIREQIIAGLGKPPEELFASFDEQPFAAASIGQVHRARTHDGQDCVVKVQYPGVKASCDSDLKHLRRLFKLAGLVKVSQAVMDDVFEEVRQILHEELDYLHEADNIRHFHRYYADHPYVVVPQVIDELTSDTVLTMTRVDGDPLAEVKAPRYEQATINLLGERIFETFGEQIFKLAAVHADPHPGNLAFRPDGSLVLYDFGAIKSIPSSTLDKLRSLIRDVLEGHFDRVDGHLFALGARQNKGESPDLAFYREWIDIVTTPFQPGRYDFSQSNLHRRAMGKAKRDGLRYVGAFQPSTETLVINRVITGHYWTLVSLGSTIELRPLLYRITGITPA